MTFLFFLSMLALTLQDTSGFVAAPLSFLTTNPSTSHPFHADAPFANALENCAPSIHTFSPSNGAATYRRTGTTFLQATKKSSSTSASASKKVQVKLLKHMAGIGQAGDVVQVTPAFYQNKLRPTHSAVMVTEDQVNEERQKAKEQEEALHQLALQIKERFSSSDEEGATKGPVLCLSRKAGPGGQLFGGIGPKTIVDELKHILTAENKSNQVQFLDQKTVKIISITDDKGEKLEQIKHLGEGFVAKIALTKDVSVDLTISVEVEH